MECTDLYATRQYATHLSTAIFWQNLSRLLENEAICLTQLTAIFPESFALKFSTVASVSFGESNYNQKHPDCLENPFDFK